MWRRIVSNFGQDGIGRTAREHRTMTFSKAVAMWLGANVVVTTILTGMLLVPDLPYLQALWIVAAGSALGAIGLALVGVMGTRTGLPTMVLARGAFGVRGSNLPAAVNLVILIGWSWVQALLAGMSMNYAVEATFGYSNLPLFTILCEVLVVLIVLRGHVGIERIQAVVATTMVILAGFVFYALFSRYDVGALLAMPVESRSGITAAIAFDIVLATAFSWYVLAADFNRNATSQAGGMGGTVIGYVLATVIAMGLGATVSGFSILAGMQQTYDPTVLLAEFGFGIPAALVVFLSVMTTNVMAVYGAVMSYMNIRPQDGFGWPALAIGTITVIGALWEGILNQFQDFLLLIGTLFIPVFAIMLADYFVAKRGYYAVEDVLGGKEGAYWYTGGYNVPAWVAYVIGAGLAFYWTQVSPLSFGATVPTFVLTFALYLLFRAAADRLGSRRAAGAKPERVREAR
jgi:NCS1 family nucleobase:cation symporter-1